MKKSILILLASFTGFAVTGFSQIPLAPAKEPEKEILYKEKYDGYKYKVVPSSAKCDNEKAEKENCEKKEPVPVPKPKPRPKPQPPKPKPQPKPQPQPKCDPCPSCPKVEPEKHTYYKAHEVSILAGYGADGMQTTEKPDGTQVNKYYGLILGARYTYRFDPSWSVSVEGLTNNTGMLGIGYSFGENKMAK